jgi:hypothetical protein
LGGLSEIKSLAQGDKAISRGTLEYQTLEALASEHSISRKIKFELNLNDTRAISKHASSRHLSRWLP